MIVRNERRLISSRVGLVSSTGEARCYFRWFFTTGGPCIARTTEEPSVVLHIF